MRAVAAIDAALPCVASRRKPAGMNGSSARADVKGSGNIVVQAIGSGINVTIDACVPHLRLTQFEARTRRADDGSDAALLSAYRTDVVPLLGRERDLDGLTRPDAFLPELARSLESQGQACMQAGRHTDASGAFCEGLAIIVPFAERTVQAFGDLAGLLRRGYITACAEAGTARDAALLERVARTIDNDDEKTGG